MPSADEHNGLFVMLLLDGRSYAYLSNPLSHGPQRELISSVDSIHNATAQSRGAWRLWLNHGTLIPVTVERRVTIIPG